MKYYCDALAHHGVKGMKWGVRHDKPTGKKKRSAFKRYMSGRSVAGEYREEWRRSTAADREKRSDIEDQMDLLKETYDIDEYGESKGGYLNHLGAKQYRQLNEEFESIEARIRDTGRKYASEKIINKYGKQKLSDFDYYEGVNTIMVGTALAASVAGLFVYGMING